MAMLVSTTNCSGDSEIKKYNLSSEETIYKGENRCGK
jgi:hypothetical protein